MDTQHQVELPKNAAGQIRDWHGAWRHLMGKAWDHALAIGCWIFEADEQGESLLASNLPLHEILAFRTLAQGNQLVAEIGERAAAGGAEQGQEFARAREEDERQMAETFRRWAEADEASIQATLQLCRGILDSADATPAQLIEAARLARRALNRARVVVIG